MGDKRKPWKNIRKRWDINPSTRVVPDRRRKEPKHLKREIEEALDDGGL